LSAPSKPSSACGWLCELVARRPCSGLGGGERRRRNSGRTRAGWRRARRHVRSHGRSTAVVRSDPGSCSRPLHYDLPDDDYGPERPAYEHVPPVVEGKLEEVEGPFGITHVIEGIVVDPRTIETA
jgi:hypothetical protein